MKHEILRCGNHLLRLILLFFLAFCALLLASFDEAQEAAAKGNYRVAAVQGHGEAQNALRYLFRCGLDVKQNFVEAIETMKCVLQLAPGDSSKRPSYTQRLEQYRQGIVAQL